MSRLHVFVVEWKTVSLNDWQPKFVFSTKKLAYFMLRQEKKRHSECLYRVSKYLRVEG